MKDDQQLPELIKTLFLNEEKEGSIKSKLYPVVQELLLHDTARLYQVLYRIDVKEEKVKKAFDDNPLLEVVAERITNLIIERQMEKMQWRKKYSSRENPEE